MTKPTGRPVGRPRKDEVRDDGPYANFVTGLGTTRDASSYTQAALSRVFTEDELENLYIGDGFARRLVDVPAQDMVRAGFEIEVEGDDESEDVYAPVMARLEELNLLSELSDAQKLAALYGGALIVVGVKDGGELEDPINEKSIQGIEFLRVYDRYRVSRMKRYTDPADSRYGQTEIYMVSPVLGTPYRVHESRCLVFQGEFVPERRKEMQDGWMGSRLAHCWQQLQRLGVSHQWAEKLLERSQQAVNKMNGLAQQLGAPGGQNAAMNRLHLLDMSRNILNTVAIDSNDDYTIHTASMSGIPDVLDRFAQALSAVSGMPKTLLFGEQAKGLNNGGEGDMLLWQGQIKQWQKTKLLKPIDTLVKWLSIALKIPEQDYMIEFCDILEPNEKEEAEIEKLEAETKKIEAETAAAYVTAGALDPSELRNTLMKDSDYVMDGTVVIGAEDDGLPA